MIDWTRVQDLHDDIGSRAFSQVINLFLDEIAPVLLRLKAHPDHLQLEMDLHYLKGAVLNLGFTQVATLCHEGEGMASQGSAHDVDIENILRAYDHARQVFLSEFAQRLGH